MTRKQTNSFSWQPKTLSVKIRLLVLNQLGVRNFPVSHITKVRQIEVLKIFYQLILNTEIRYSLIIFQHSQLHSMYVLQDSTSELTPHKKFLLLHALPLVHCILHLFHVSASLSTNRLLERPRDMVATKSKIRKIWTGSATQKLSALHLNCHTGSKWPSAITLQL